MDNKALTDAVTRYKNEAKILAAKSKRWQTFFELAALENIAPWKIVSFIYDQKSGTDISREVFHFERSAKLLASVENTRVKETLHKIQDLVDWNRNAVLAMMEEAIKYNEFTSYERGEKTLDLINVLFPEFLLED